MSMVNDKMRKILKLLKKSKKIALFSHISPDPDTIGSTMALFYALKSLKKDVYLFCDDNLERFAFVEADKLYNICEIDDTFDLFVSVDVATLARVGSFADKFEAAKSSIRIDHHKSGDDFAENNLMISYSASGILIYDIITKLRINITEKIATLLYFAICGDTGGFRFDNTDALTFEVCGKLIKKGANIRWIYSEFFDKKSVSALKLTSNALLQAKINDELKYVIMKIQNQDYHKFGAKESEYVGNLPNMYLNCGYKIACIIKEKSDAIKASVRSKFEYDCCCIAEKFGGGGHKNAAGINFGNSFSLDEIEEKIKTEIENYLMNETNKAGKSNEE